MKKLFILFVLTAPVFFTGCSNDDDGGTPVVDKTGESKTFTLSAVSDASISGTAIFEENKDGSTTISLDLKGTSSGSHPAHIHMNTAAESGDIVLDLTSVDGSTGMSSTLVEAFNDGTAVTYSQLLEYDGYINVHESAENLGTLIAQGDIGQNELNGTSKEYTLSPKSNPSISGTATFSQRVNGTTLVTLALDGTVEGDAFPAHIHSNSAAESGAIIIDLDTIRGPAGVSYTQVAALNNDEAISYDELLKLDGYINAHLSADNLGVLVAQGDIGINELTGNSEEYPLGSVSNPSISGTATLSERINGSTLITIALDGTSEGDAFPAHIHQNTAAESGAIVINLDTIRGPSGISLSQIDTLNTGETVTYNELLEFDGYINAHLSAANLGVLVAQGDIGQNKLTGNKTEYTLSAVSDPAVSGVATFSERVNGETLVTLALVGTVSEGLHPAHIHAGSVADAPGAIVIDLIDVAGTTGLSKTNVAAYNDGTAINYSEMTAIDGYINVHLSAADITVLIAQGNVGSNAE